MAGGAIFYKWMGYLTFLSPYLIFLMLFITYCKLDFKHIRPTRFHLILMMVQMGLSLLAYLALLPVNHVVAEGVFICIYIPTDTSAPVITSMLGG
ncbi:MAG: transporter, partial [Muribaculaceae bacterium]|nr:transporter [Muribaculaceae bacterium]